MQRNRKDNDGPDNDFLEQGRNNGSYNTRSSIGLEMTSRIPGTEYVDQYVHPSTTKLESLDSHEIEYHTSMI